MLRENRDTECNSLTINGKSKGKSATGFDVLAPETTNQLTLMTNILLLSDPRVTLALITSLFCKRIRAF